MTRAVPTEQSFTSPSRSTPVSARVGRWLGILIGICFVTGLASHAAQDLVWFPWPTRPSWGYRVTQGAHVIAGVAAIPLLLVKLWSVFPRLFARPLIRGFLHGLERLSIALLVASVIFELTTGLLNIAKLYLWPFDFRTAHYAVAWIAAGALLVHIAVKLPIIRMALGMPLSDDPVEEEAPQSDSRDPAGNIARKPVVGPLTRAEASRPERRMLVVPRRTVVRTAYLASGLAALSVAGGSIPWLSKLAVFSPNTGTGPQGYPINRTAEAAGITEDAVGSDYRLQLVGPERTVQLTLDELAAMTQSDVDLSIACVEGWSYSARWSGVPVRDLLELVGAPADSRVRVVSLQTRAAYAESVLPPQHSADPTSLLALSLDGEELALDHGFPCRLIAPSRPGVLQTKWVTQLEVIG